MTLFVTACTGSPKVCDGYHVEKPVPMTKHETGLNNPVLTLDEALARLSDADDWKTHPPLDLPRHPADKYLEGWVIVLDPGHGGKSLEVDGWKMGPTGVREAEMNLRVGLMLRQLLERAGATVGMTRTEETSDIADDRIGDYNHNAPGSDNPAQKSTLQLRAEYANNFERPEGAKFAGIPDEHGVSRGADLFISIHHNASSSPESNYTTVWFHGPAEDATVELDAARHLAREIGRALRTDVGKTSPVMNDRQMYEHGFGVLRHATVPAVLTESSFYTNPDEEQRLNNPGYLIREAYAMYTALCELAYSGRPTQTIELAPLSPERMGFLMMNIELDDGLPDWWGHEQGRILPTSISVQIGGLEIKPMASTQNSVTGHIKLLLARQLPIDEIGVFLEDAGFNDAADKPDEIELTIHHANFLKAHNWPQRYAVELKWEPGAEAPEVVAVRPLGAPR